MLSYSKPFRKSEKKIKKEKKRPKNTSSKEHEEEPWLTTRVSVSSTDDSGDDMDDSIPLASGASSLGSNIPKRPSTSTNQGGSATLILCPVSVISNWAVSSHDLLLTVWIPKSALNLHGSVEASFHIFLFAQQNISGAQYTIEQCALPVTTIMALWQLMTGTHDVHVWLHIVGLHCGVTRLLDIFLQIWLFRAVPPSWQMIVTKTGWALESCHNVQEIQLLPN